MQHGAIAAVGTIIRSSLIVGPRDEAMLHCQLVLGAGRWNDRQVPSTDWIEPSTAAKIEGTGGLFDRYLRWPDRSLRSTGLARLVPGSRLASCQSSILLLQDHSPRALQVQCGIFRDVVRGISHSGLRAVRT